MKNVQANTYVYCIQERGREANAPIKVGVARSPEQRLTNLQVGNPMLLKIYRLIGPMTQRKAINLEARIHGDLSKYRIRGEWFTGNAIDLFDVEANKHKSVYSGHMVCNGGRFQPKLVSNEAT